MADQRTIKKISRAMSSISNEQNFPSQITICSLVHDYEDILFISPGSVNWDWMKGMTTVRYYNYHSVIILTRQRLVLAGGSALPFQLEYPLSDIRKVYEATYGIRVICLRNFANDPPNPPNEQTGYRSFPKDGREEVSYELHFPDFRGENTKLFKVLKALPYPIMVQYEDWQKESPWKGVSFNLPVHPDILIWNQLNISLEALQTISEWIATGKLFPDGKQIKEMLRQEESVYYLTKVMVDYGFQMILTEEETGHKFLRNIPGWDKRHKRYRGSNFTSSIVILTSQRILFIIEENLTEIISLEFDDIIKIVDVKENSNYELIFGRAQYPKIEIYFGQQAYLLSPLLDQDFLGFLGEIQSIGFREKIVSDRDIPFFEDKKYALKTSVSFDVTNKVLPPVNPSETDPSKSGYVYIFINFQLPPNTLKIGKTVRSPEERAGEIYTTGVPGEFIVAYEEHVLDCDAAEAAIHSRLANYRINNQREFFRLPLKDAVKVVNQVALEIGILE